MFKTDREPPDHYYPMTNEQTIDETSEQPADPATGGDELPIFPTTAPPVFSDAEATVALFEPLFERLADVVEIPDEQLTRPTPCRGFNVEQLRNHVLGWLSFFAAALSDPSGAQTRPDADSWTISDGHEPAGVVERAAAAIISAARDGVGSRVVTMSQARMAGDGVLAMALGEYLVHGWDLASATGRTWSGPNDDDWCEAAEPALAFLRTTVAPEYRGEDSGFFGQEVAAADDATAFERLLCFAGRDPSWTAPARA
jgi:uncharacterized protein (TIGR03086 family)